MVNLNGHEAGNGGYSQREPTAHWGSSTRNSPRKKEPKAKRVKAHQRPVQRETKEVLAELVEKLRGKLEPKATSASQGEAPQRAELSPNLDRLTVGVDLGDRWSHYCILGLQGETLSLRPESCWN